MPTFDFRCADDHIYEILVPMGTDIAECPACRKPAVRIFSPPIENLRASGNFYAPDGRKLTSASEYRDAIAGRRTANEVEAPTPDRLEPFLNDKRAQREAWNRAGFKLRNGRGPIRVRSN